MEKTIFVVDDDIAIGNLLEELLVGEGYAVRRAYSGTEALLLMERQRPDLVLLDLMLPGLSGEAILPQITQTLAGVPVIVLSAKADIQGKVQLLLGGAVDYITKPFHSGELLARVAVQLRKSANPNAPALASGNLRLDPQSMRATIHGTPIKLTRTEFAILKLLMSNPGQVIPKATILDRISPDTPDCTDSSLKQHVSNLRKKLRESGAGDPIESIWGIGFKFEADPTRPPPSPN